MNSCNNFSIAKIGYSLLPDQDISIPDIPENMRPFISNAPADYTFRVTRSEFLYPLKEEYLSFRTSQWFFYQLDDRFVLKVALIGMDDSFVYVEIIPGQFCGTIYIDQNFYRHHCHPLSNPILETIFITTLARHGGLLAHSSGILQGKRAIAFMGSSGSGKTTTARLWERYASAFVLCDDRIAIRMIDGVFWAFGTPFHGEHPVVSPLGAPLSKILFLKHASENRATLLKASQSSAMLYARSFPPLWDRTGLNSYVDTSVKLAGQVPCYEYGFIPNESAVEYIVNL